MDTIIYLYRWKQPGEWTRQNRQKMPQLYCREDFDLPDYHLIKVGMTEPLLQICHDSEIAQKDCLSGASGGFLAGWQRRRKLRQEQWILADFLQKIMGEQEPCGVVCEEPIPYFAPWRFNGYFEAAWVRHLLRYGNAGQTDRLQSDQACLAQSHFMILGQALCVPEILYEHVRSIKSLKWILPGRQFREEQQELVDALYEEYGLAVELRFLSEEESYKQVYPVCRVPSLVLDFSEEGRIPTADVARGSIWLDMASSEEKRRRIEDRDTGILYFSLKKEWKQPQKALIYLDTMGKNRYNT